MEPVYKDDWELLAGTVDSDESLYDAAIRELKEELGLSMAPGRVLPVDLVPPRSGRTKGVMFVYDGGVPSAAVVAEIRVPDDDFHGWAWSCAAPDRRRRSMPPDRYGLSWTPSA